MCTIMCCVQIPQMCDILKDDCFKYRFFFKTIIFFTYSSLKINEKQNFKVWGFHYILKQLILLNYYIVHVFKAERGSVYYSVRT